MVFLLACTVPARGLLGPGPRLASAGRLKPGIVIVMLLLACAVPAHAQQATDHVQVATCGSSTCALWVGGTPSTLSATGSGACTCTWLSLDHKGIEVIANNTFSRMGSLQTLYLHSNQISVVGDHAFSGLGSLRTLYLDSNQISVVGNHTFSGLGSLQYLYLHSNQISVVGDHAFSGLGSQLGRAHD